MPEKPVWKNDSSLFSVECEGFKSEDRNPRPESNPNSEARRQNFRVLTGCGSMLSSRAWVLRWHVFGDTRYPLPPSPRSRKAFLDWERRVGGWIEGEGKRV